MEELERYPDEVDFTFEGGPLDGQTDYTWPEIGGVEAQEEYHVITIHSYDRSSPTTMKYVESRTKVLIDTRKNHG